ncbi:MAG: carbohydrate ABC transporter permease [Firmicutes bacterium]|jgi:multiple sugar transport system permease protein|nr:carbohydrate ABC transporter permease [Bacillota bacterium]
MKRRMIVYLVVVPLCLIWLLPVWTSLLVAFKNLDDYAGQSFWQLPSQWYLVENLKYAWTKARLGVYFINSMLYAVVGAAGSIVLASLASFSIARLKPKGANLLFALIFSGTVFPFQMYLVPLFKAYQQLNLYDTKLGMMLFYIAICTPFATLIFRAFFSTIPNELMEAARLDGCSDLRIYLQMFMPVSLPAAAVVAVFQFTWVWNDLLFGLILTCSADTRPIMVGLAQLQGARAAANMPGLMAGAVIASIPTIAVFTLLRRYFIQGLALQTAGE